MGALHLTKNFGLHFPKFPVVNGTAFSTISWIKDNLISKTFLPGISVQFDFQGLHFIKLTIFEFTGNFLKISVPWLPPFPKLWYFWLNRKFPVCQFSVNYSVFLGIQTFCKAICLHCRLLHVICVLVWLLRNSQWNWQNFALENISTLKQFQMEIEKFL